ncbi:transcription termination factor NusA [Spiroplasma endosymbiont of Nebria brevicollis]|uniref:transcription termination factor NusA n=1 Tax=Spiroplasma endosymbiont of Nebria brevicollis TaxID=3066284 RepID=UPI00313CAB24
MSEKERNEIILAAISLIAEEKQINEEDIIEALKEGLIKAYERQSQSDTLENIRVEIALQKGEIKIYQDLKVVAKVEDIDTEIALSTVKKLNPDLTIGDTYTKLIPTDQFSRLSIFQAIQVVKQSIREAEKTSIYDEFIDKKDHILIGTVESREETYMLIKIGRAYAFLPRQNQIPNEIPPKETPIVNTEHIKFYVEDIIKNKNYGQILASRTHPNFLRCLLELEVPEIAQGVIEIKDVARIPGIRAKVAILSHDPSIDGIGACIGKNGERTKLVTTELSGEKIDIIAWSPDIKTYIINALTPAKVISITIDEQTKQANIIVPTEQLSLAIGKNGMAAKLAAGVTHWNINISSLEQAQESDIKFTWNGNIKENEYDHFIKELKKKTHWNNKIRY